LSFVRHSKSQEEKQHQSAEKNRTSRKRGGNLAVFLSFVKKITILSIKTENPVLRYNPKNTIKLGITPHAATTSNFIIVGNTKAIWN